ncbi:hypothetical protein OX283_003745 [Flavobacterium sp. SUN052]|uniref:hypothetical protein n=1 Tax=Flavobacterium sp. SUN052 TaxID=3002441 RepID=UPI00237E0023|nr:hypothetical protein [Flavobacterium sp. SUN052]MEC4003757.1 hypothetical protein [Flavobacterium sp. SUN052]
MTTKLIVLFLLTAFFSMAQTNAIKKEIKETKNQKLIEYVDSQDRIFDELENYLKEINQQEFKSINDSINGVKFSKLMGFYYQLSRNAAKSYSAPESKIQYVLLDRYMVTRLKTVDNLYALFTSKRVDEKVVSENNLVLSVNDNGIEIQPIYESCKGTPDEKTCTFNFIRKKLANNYEVPELREIGNQQLRTAIQFVITKNGQIAFTSNSSSCGYFEYDMELIKVFNQKFANDKFIPAIQNGKNVNCRYVIPLAIVAP